MAASRTKRVRVFTIQPVAPIAPPPRRTATTRLTLSFDAPASPRSLNTQGLLYSHPWVHAPLLHTPPPPTAKQLAALHAECERCERSHSSLTSLKALVLAANVYAVYNDRDRGLGITTDSLVSMV